MDTSINPMEIKLRPFKPNNKDSVFQKGKLNIVRVNQMKDTLYYFVQGASIYSPVYVGLTSLDPSIKVKVQLYKMNWKNADRTGVTNTKGHWSEKFKTENDFGIMVIPETKPAKYSILVWVGNEAKLEMPTVFSGEEKNDTNSGSEGKSGMSNTLLYIIIGLLAVIAGILLYKKKKSAS